MSRPPPISTLFPYTTLFRSRIESFANAIRGELVFRFAGFLVEDQQQIAGQHAVEIFKSNLADLTLRVRTPDDAFSIDVVIDPVFDVLEIARFARSFVNEILAVEIERLCVTPRAEVLRGWVALHGRFNHPDRPVGFAICACN